MSEFSEYCYYATALIWGKDSPKIDHYSSFKLSIFRQITSIEYREEVPLKSSTERTRTLYFLTNSDYLETSNTLKSSQANQILSYVNHIYSISISDALFPDDSFKYYNENWNKYIESKIQRTAILIQMLDNRDMRQVCRLLHDFPNISQVLLTTPEIWTVSK